MFRTIVRFAAVAAVCAGLVACSTTREAKYEEVKTGGEVNTDKVAEGDAAWAERGSQAKVEAAIAAWEAAAAEGADFDLYVKLSRGNYFLADGFHALAGNAEKRDEHYTAGLDWAEAKTRVDGDEWRVELEKNRQTLYDALGAWGVPSYRLLDAEGKTLLRVWGADRLWLVAAFIRERLAA